MKNEQQNNQADIVLIHLDEVAKMLQMYPATVMRWVRRGVFPPPYKYNGSNSLFDLQAIRNAVIITAKNVWSKAAE